MKPEGLGEQIGPADGAATSEIYVPRALRVHSKSTRLGSSIPVGWSVVRRLAWQPIEGASSSAPIQLERVVSHSHGRLELFIQLTDAEAKVESSFATDARQQFQFSHFARPPNATWNQNFETARECSESLASRDDRRRQTFFRVRSRAFGIGKKKHIPKAGPNQPAALDWLIRVQANIVLEFLLASSWHLRANFYIQAKKHYDAKLGSTHRKSSQPSGAQRNERGAEAVQGIASVWCNQATSSTGGSARKRGIFNS